MLNNDRTQQMYSILEEMVNSAKKKNYKAIQKLNESFDIVTGNEPLEGIQIKYDCCRQTFVRLYFLKSQIDRKAFLEYGMKQFEEERRGY